MSNTISKLPICPCCLHRANKTATSPKAADNSAGSPNSGDNTFAAGTTNWERDLHGLRTFRDLSVTTGGGVTDTFASDSYVYDDLGHLTNEINKLSTESLTLENTATYTQYGQLSTYTDYAGTTFHHHYDNMKRLVRFCYAAENEDECAGLGDDGGCTTGETYVRDSITGRITEVTHFVNPETTCSETGNGKDVPGDSIHFVYTPFDAISSKTYVQNVIGSENGQGEPITVTLRWGYDPYQRPVCFRDAMASTEVGEMSSVCGNENTAVPLDFVAPSPSNPEDRYLSWNLYYPDSDPYRRGLLQTACRIVSSAETASSFDTRCTDIDYYTPVSTDGGSCTDAPIPLSAPGAYAGRIKSQTQCKGGSCATGNGTVVYETTHDYDSHRRTCRVVSTDSDGAVILGSTYQYDQYNNLLSETSFSDLDTSTGSNYQLSYTYDGMQRLLNSTRRDLSGTLIQTINYELDAASNVETKVEETYEGAAESTSTANYTYNADGALTEVMVTTDGASTPEVTTLVWDNYDGSTNPPTIRAANGNLQRVEGPGGSTKSYVFDARDRLIGMQASSQGIGTQSVEYTYNPASLLATSTWDEGAYRFYYDMNRNAQAVNVIQADSTWGASALASARMGRDRYLSDGTNQFVVRHRKDSDALYDPATSSVTKYNYEPYGAPLEGTQEQGDVSTVRRRKPTVRERKPSTRHRNETNNVDLHQNQFRYSNEYTDSLTGAQYLRARWYDPELQVFLSRDPVANLSRYGYAGGDPVNRIDASGQTSEEFFHALEHSFVQNFTSVFGLRPMFSKGYWTQDNKNVQWWLNTVLVIGQAALMAAEVPSGAVLGYESIYTPLARGGAVLGTANIGATLFSTVRGAVHGEDAAEIAGNILGGYAAGMILAGGTASVSLGGGWLSGYAFYDSPFDLRGSDLARVALQKSNDGSQDVDVFLERAVLEADERDHGRDVGRHDISGKGWASRAHAQLIFVGSDFVRKIDYGTNDFEHWRDSDVSKDISSTISHASDTADAVRRIQSRLGRGVAGANDIITDEPAFMKLSTLSRTEYTQAITAIQARAAEIHNGAFKIDENNCFDAASRAARILFGFD